MTVEIVYIGYRGIRGTTEIWGESIYFSMILKLKKAYNIFKSVWSMLQMLQDVNQYYHLRTNMVVTQLELERHINH